MNTFKKDENFDKEKLVDVCNEIKSIAIKHGVNCFSCVASPENGTSRFYLSDWTGLRLGYKKKLGKKIITNNDKVIIDGKYDHDNIVISGMVNRYLLATLISKVKEVGNISKLIFKHFNINFCFDFDELNCNVSELNKISEINENKFTGYSAVRNELLGKMTEYEKINSITFNENKINAAHKEFNKLLEEFDVSCFLVIFCKTHSMEWFYFPSWTGLFINDDGKINLNYNKFKTDIFNPIEINSFFVINFLLEELFNYAKLLGVSLREICDIINKNFLLH